MNGEKIVEMSNISVEFPGVKALDDVQFELKRGEVHVLLGENGAGKSTIMKVLAGVNTDYKGTVIYKGEEIRCASVREQQERGISIIFQETNLLRNLTVAENIFLGRYPKKPSGAVDWKAMHANARSLLDSIHSNVSERAKVSSLSVGQMQMVEIAKAISFDSDIIIMDEPTSALTEVEVKALFHIISQLKAKNVGVVYISHRLEEIVQIGDRVTILRDGKYIQTIPVKDTDVDGLARLMVGRELSEKFPKVRVKPGETLLEVKHLQQKPLLQDISFYVRRGEIVGFYGLMGAGRTELMRAVFGADAYDSGEICVNQTPIRINNCATAKKHGLALLTEDRKQQGLILDFSIQDNISLVNYRKVMNIFGINPGKEMEVAEKLTESVQTKTPSMKQKVKLLSGGNQQKVVIAKWLNADPEVLIFDEPTRGIDVGAKVEIYKIMNELKQQGKAVIMVSSELPEAIGVSDRLYVMQNGKIMNCFEQMEGLTEDDVIKYAAAVSAS
ncbi:sugar ABC transporter ATP-binding protein [Ruminococcus gauvreauii]|uniref:Sugar ABC transporter ATP-binding protein n=1 Tax=Ruminococcus gauvreauii TaxID=438033 RepID=A0ABY5VDI1_9FIRM|nr:sugar ABC transporter ATP-binding protein [Ruminococcus gauvreauii]UWP58282.1 sugar ABC transporter ATP-binding protein [Ruminococcus gauvreauii]